MKRLVNILCLVLICLLSSVSLTRAEDQYPDHVGYINDYSGVLSTVCRDSLNSLLHSYELRSGNQFVVVISDSKVTSSIEEYANGLFKDKKWGIGDKHKKNGLLLIWLRHEDQRKLRFEVGYGLEPYLTDSRCKQIQLQMVPELKAGHFDAGIALGINQAIAILDREIALDTPPKPPTAAELQQQQEDRQRSSAQMKTGLFMGFILCIIVGAIGFIGYLLHRRDEKNKQQQATYDACGRYLDAASKGVELVDKAAASLLKDIRAIPREDILLGHTVGAARCEMLLKQIEPWKLEIDKLNAKYQADGLRDITANAASALDLKGRIDDQLEALTNLLNWLGLQAGAQAKVPEKLDQVRRLIAQHQQRLVTIATALPYFEQAIRVMAEAERQATEKPVAWLEVLTALERAQDLVDRAVKAAEPKPPVKPVVHRPRPTERPHRTSELSHSPIYMPDDAVDRHRDGGWSAPSDPSPSYDSPNFGGGDSGGGGATTDV